MTRIYWRLAACLSAIVLGVLILTVPAEAQIDLNTRLATFLTQLAGNAVSGFTMQTPVGSSGAPSINFTGDTTTGFYRPGASQVGITLGGTPQTMIYQNGINEGSAGAFSWSSTTDPTGGADTTLARTAAGFVGSNGAKLTAGSGTGITVNNVGALTTQVYKVTVASTAFTCNATTCDITLATMPAKSFVQDVVADITSTFACAAVCTTSTLSFTVGKTAGGNEFLLSVDADAATGQFGRTSATLGASLAPGTSQTLTGDNASWTTTTAVVLRMTSGTGAVGTGAATNFSQGSVTVYITATQYP